MDYEPLVGATFWRTKEWAMFQRSTHNFHGHPFPSTTSSNIHGFSLLSHMFRFVAIKSSKYYVHILMLLLWCNLLPCCLWALLCFSHRLSMFSCSVPQDTFKVYALEHKFLIPQLNESKGVSWYQKKEEILSLVIIMWPPHRAWAPSIVFKSTILE